jgi:anti-sigma-K factor RskA
VIIKGTIYRQLANQIRRLEQIMSGISMIDNSKLETIERTLIGVEKAVVELATIQKESAKREERMYTRIESLEHKFDQRDKALQEQVRQNTNMLWKHTGATAAIVTIVTLSIAAYSAFSV